MRHRMSSAATESELIPLQGERLRNWSVTHAVSHPRQCVAPLRPPENCALIV